MQGFWTLVYYTWKKNLRLFMGHNSAGFHWTFHFHFPLKRLNTNRTIHFVNYCGLWTLMVWHFWQLYAHRWMFLVLLREGTKKISLSAIRCSTTEPQRLYNDRNPLRSSYMTLPRWSPDEKHLSLFLHRAQNLRVTQYAGRVSYMNFVMGLAHHRVSGAQW